MAAGKEGGSGGSKEGAKGRRTRQSQRVNIWLPPDQIAWLKGRKNQSDVIRALITEAINLENLAKSVKGGKKK